MNQHLILLDFDGTLANTFEKSPNGWGVENASSYAIGQVFGREGVKIFEERGGLQNNDPSELVADIATRIGFTNAPLADLTQGFVDAKLALLMNEISPQWPRLYPGVKGFIGAVSEGFLPLDYGIISSGHEQAIKKIFEVNELSVSKILITNDLLRERRMPLRPKHKPNPYLFAEAHRQWLVMNSVLPRFDGLSNGDQYMGRSLGKPNMIYVGDDPVKDGGLALEARIPFIHVPFVKPDFVPDPDKGQMSVANFNDLLVRLDWNRQALLDGQSFAQVLFGRNDRELFPPPVDGEVYRRILREGTFR